jgi:hypothetical protein
VGCQVHIPTKAAILADNLTSISLAVLLVSLPMDMPIQCNLQPRDQCALPTCNNLRYHSALQTTIKRALYEMSSLPALLSTSLNRPVTSQSALTLLPSSRARNPCARLTSRRDSNWLDISGNTILLHLSRALVPEKCPFSAAPQSLRHAIPARKSASTT